MYLLLPFKGAKIKPFCGVQDEKTREQKSVLKAQLDKMARYKLQTRQTWQNGYGEILPQTI